MRADGGLDEGSGGGRDEEKGKDLGCVLEAEFMRFTDWLDGRRRTILYLNLKVTYVDLIKINRTNSNPHLLLSLTQWLSLVLLLCVRQFQVHSFDKYLWSTYYAPGTLWGATDNILGKADTVLPPEALRLSEGDSYLSNNHTANERLCIIRKAKREEPTRL